MISTAFGVSAMTKALEEAIAYITKQVFEESGLMPSGPMQWVPLNEKQSKLMQRYRAVSADLSNLSELKAWAETTAEELNQILAEHDFSMRMEPWQEDPNHFGVVVIYDIRIKWLVTGPTADGHTGTEFHLPESNKPAFWLSEEEADLSFFRVDRKIIVKIPVEREGDYLCLTRADKPLAQFDLLAEVERLRNEMNKSLPVFDYDGVVLPNIVFDTGPDGIDISWLVGLKTEDAVGNPREVVQAKMQAKFTMGPKGARPMCSTVSLDAIRPDYVADHNLLVWIERDGVLSEPLFVAYVSTDEFAHHTIGLDKMD